MTNAPITHFVLVDFENVSAIDLSLLGTPRVVIALFLGEKQKKLPAVLVQQLIVHPAEVRLVKVGKTGSNFLDLTLANYLGGECQHHSSAQFHIVSKDKDFDLLIGFLTGTGIKCTRCDSFAALPFMNPVKKSNSPKPPPALKVPSAKPAPGKPAAEARLDRFITSLRNPQSTNRPAKRRTLITHIKSSLGPETTDAEADKIVSRLCSDGVLSIIVGDKVQYPNAGTAGS